MRGIRGFFKRALVLVAVLSAVTAAYAAATASATGNSTNASDGQLSVITVPPTTGADSSQTSTAGAGAAALQQRIGVRINGGPLTITPSTINVTLTRVGHAYKGSLPAVQITEARGSLAGWTATVAAATLPAGTRLHVHPGKPVAVTGLQGEVTAAQPGPSAGAPVVLASAQPNGGGGEFSVDAALELVAPSTTAQTLTLSLNLAVS